MSASPSIARNVTVTGANGLHMIPCSRLASLASRFQSSITIRHKDHSVDARSPLELLTLGASQGTELTIEANGTDAQMAVEAIVKLFERDFALEDAAGPGHAGSSDH